MQTFVALSSGLDDSNKTAEVRTWTFLNSNRVRCVFEVVENSSNCQLIGTSDDMRRIAARILALAAEAEQLGLDS